MAHAPHKPRFPDNPLDDAHASFPPYLKWVIIAALAAVELGFDLWLEPMLGTGSLLEERIEAYMAFAEVIVIGSLIWGVFRQLEGLEGRLAQRRRDLVKMYDQAKEWDRQLEALNEASVAISRENAYPEVLSLIVSLAAQLGRAHYGALAEFDDEERVVQFVTYGVPVEVQDRIGLPPIHRGLLKRLSGLHPVRIDDIFSDPDFTGFPLHHHQFRTFLGVPIRWEGQLLGHLYLGGHQDETPFAADEERLLEMFAMEAAVAIRRSRLDRESAMRVRAAERRMIAMQLHDSALQSLYAVGLQLDRARRHGLTMLSDSMSLPEALSAVETSMSAIRGVLDVLERDSLRSQEGAIRPAEATARLYGVELSWFGTEHFARLTAGQADILGNCLKEAVANAARHGQAHSVQIRIVSGSTGLDVTVTDDGQGPPAEGLVTGYGLTNVQRRLETIGGELNLQPRSEGGVIFSCHLPLPPIQAAGVTGETGEAALAK